MKNWRYMEVDTTAGNSDGAPISALSNMNSYCGVPPSLVSVKINSFLNSFANYCIDFGTIWNPISMMQQEHEIAIARFYSVSVLTNNFTPPADSCAIYKIAFAMRKAFDADLRQHIYLENHILFPRAEALEKEFSPL